MSSYDENKPNNQDSELDQLHALIKDAGDTNFTLEDILAEYSDQSKNVIPLSTDDELTPTEQEPVETPDDETVEEPDVPTQPSGEENLLIFPTAQHPQAEDEEYEEEDCDACDTDDAQDELSPEDEAAEEDEEDEAEDDVPDNVLEFPGLRSPLANLIHKLTRKANRFAEQMFVEEDRPVTEEERLREKLVPGVDQEDNSRPVRRYRQPQLSGPDTPPQELVRKYSKGLKSLRVRSLFILLLLLPALYVTLCDILPIPAIPNPWAPGQPLLTLAIRNWVGAGLLAVSMLLGLDVLSSGVRQLRHLHINTDAILLLGCVFSLADAIAAPFLALPRAQTGYFALNMLGLFYALQGEHHRRRGLRLACRTAASSAKPYLVTLDEGKWNGRNTYLKHTDTPEGFGRQIQAPDGAQKMFALICPVLLCACFVLPVLFCLIGKRYSQLLWAPAAVYTAAYSLAAPLLFSRPFHKLARRLNQCGAAIAGWPGVVQQNRGDSIVLGDLDLFPAGTVTFHGTKTFGDWSIEHVTGYTATLIRASGCGLDKMFSDLMRTQGILYRQAEHLGFHREGGLSANIRGDQVLVGSADFMTLMGVELPQGLRVSTAVYCAINDELAGLFALNYNLPDAFFPAIDAIFRERLTPVLATRDFNLIPAMLHKKYQLAVSRLDFPNPERRRELTEPDQPHNPILTAVLCREGALPLSEAVVGGRRLRRAVRLNGILGCTGSILGAALGCYLTAMSAFASISPANLLLFLLLWLIPSWFITGGVDQY